MLISNVIYRKKSKNKPEKSITIIMHAHDVKKNSKQPKAVEEKVSFPIMPSPASSYPPGGNPRDQFLVPFLRMLCVDQYMGIRTVFPHVYKWEHVLKHMCASVLSRSVVSN